MKSLMVHYMEYLEDRDAHVNIDSLSDAMALIWEDGTVPGYSVGDSDGLSKGYKDGKFMLLVMVN